MPNHVDQDLIITGSSETLKEFMAFAEEKECLLSANKFIPYPEEFSRLDEISEVERKKGNYLVKDGFNSGGYQWCVQNWGTKWGIYQDSIKSKKLDNKNGRLKYNFQSAWAPALKIIDAMGKKFPDLTFDLKYFERGMQFKGHYIVKGDEVVKNKESKYSGRRGG
jgi:hypothetical protein